MLLPVHTDFPFGFAVTRRSDGEVLFNTTTTGSFNGLVFEDQYIEISTQLPPNPYIYGLGEHVRHLRIDADGSKHTLWARDAATPVNENIYGSHPVYLEMRNGRAHGVFLRSSNGMDISVSSSPSPRLTYQIIGGILDFYIFVGPEPESVIRQYHEVIGNPYMPPYWALGWHQCRWGYANLSEVQNVVQKYQENRIPLEGTPRVWICFLLLLFMFLWFRLTVMWTDIDYMDHYLDFSFDPLRFPVAAMQSFVDKLHANGQHYVVIVDPGIHNATGIHSFFFFIMWCTCIFELFHGF